MSEKLQPDIVRSGLFEWRPSETRLNDPARKIRALKPNRTDLFGLLVQNQRRVVSKDETYYEPGENVILRV